MTLTCNFGGRKFVRRQSAAIRLGKRLSNTIATPENLPKIKLMEKELAVLAQRMQGVPHKVFTKKTGTNTGRRNF